ncbi:MAG TPA: hypothetical protein VMS74_11620, partial [Acidimicrobiia bacterium]|nr:hypothetical protein [Acidimicrobiia bacterium]
MRLLAVFGLAVVLSIAAPAWGQIGLVEDLADDLVEEADGLVEDLADTTGDLDTGIGIIDDTVDTTVDEVGRVVDDVNGTGEEPIDPEPEPDPEPPPPAEPEPTRSPPDTRQTQVASDDREAAAREDDRADPRSLVEAAEPVEKSDDDEVTAGAGRGLDGRRTFDTLAASRKLTAATTDSASTLFDRALDWLTSSGSLLAILAGSLLALQVLLRALLSAGYGLVAPASLLAAFLAVSLHERRQPREAM